MNQVQGFRVGRVLLFLLLTFGLSWGLMLLSMQAASSTGSTSLDLPPIGMLIPAFAALLLEIFVWPDSKLYVRKPGSVPRIVVGAYLLMTLLVAALFAAGVILRPSPPHLQSMANVLFIGWTLLVIQLYNRHGDQAFRTGGLQLGGVDTAVRIGIGVVLFLLLQAVLNWVSGLGIFQGLQGRIEGIPVPGWLYPVGLIILFLLTFSGTPLGSLALTFGEEYAWRGFLQNELIKLGTRRGVFLVGLIWGLWHIPIILSGIHTYPPTIPGFLLAIVFFILWGYVQSYAALKTQSLWVPSFLHGLVNAVYAFTLRYLVRPTDKLYSFGLGVFGVLCLATVVVVLLRDPVWHTRPAEIRTEEVIQ